MYYSRPDTLFYCSLRQDILVHTCNTSIEHYAPLPSGSHVCQHSSGFRQDALARCNSIPGATKNQKIRTNPKISFWPHEVLHSIDCALVHSGPSHLKKSLPLKPSIWEREETICLENNQREHSNNLPRARSSRYWMEPKHSTFWLSPHPTPPTPRLNPNLYCEIPLV